MNNVLSVHRYIVYMNRTTVQQVQLGDWTALDAIAIVDSLYVRASTLQNIIVGENKNFGYKRRYDV